FQRESGTKQLSPRASLEHVSGKRLFLRCGGTRFRQHQAASTAAPGFGGRTIRSRQALRRRALAQGSGASFRLVSVRGIGLKMGGARFALTVFLVTLGAAASFAATAPPDKPGADATPIPAPQWHVDSTWEY